MSHPPCHQPADRGGEEEAGDATDQDFAAAIHVDAQQGGDDAACERGADDREQNEREFDFHDRVPYESINSHIAI